MSAAQEGVQTEGRTRVPTWPEIRPSTDRYNTYYGQRWVDGWVRKGAAN